MHGGTLYENAWENKPPGVFYLMRLFLLIIPDPVYALFMMSLLVYLSSGVVLFLIINQHLPSLLFSIPFTLPGLYFIHYGNTIGDGLYTESQGTLCLLLAWLLLFRGKEKKWLQLAGVLMAGCSFWFKEPFIVPAIFILFKFLAARSGVKNIVMYIAVFAIPSILFILMLLLQGSLDGFFSMLLYNFRYTGSEDKIPFSVKLESIHQHLLAPLSGLSILFLYLIYNTLTNPKSRSESVWNFSVLVATLAPSFLSPYDFGHYYIPFYAFYFVVFAEYYGLYFKTNASGLKWLIILLSIYASYKLDQSGKVKWNPELIPYKEDPISSILKNKKDATLFIDIVERGEYYVKTGLLYPTFVPVPLPVHFNDSEAGLKNRKRIWKELSTNMPDYLITGRGFSYYYWFLPESDFFTRNYHVTDSVEKDGSEMLYLWSKNMPDTGVISPDTAQY